MPNLGQYLVAEDDLQVSDMIVVLTGSFPNRILQAVDIYNARYSDELVFASSYSFNYDKFVEKDKKFHREMPN